MKTIILVSQCESEKVCCGDNRRKYSYCFHFKGVYGGEKIKKVVVYAYTNAGLEKGDEYLLYLKVLDYHEGILRGELLKSRSFKSLVWT